MLSVSVFEILLCTLDFWYFWWCDFLESINWFSNYSCMLLILRLYLPFAMPLLDFLYISAVNSCGNRRESWCSWNLSWLHQALILSCSWTQAHNKHYWPWNLKSESMVIGKFLEMSSSKTAVKSLPQTNHSQSYFFHASKPFKFINYFFHSLPGLNINFCNVSIFVFEINKQAYS